MNFVMNPLKFFAALLQFGVWNVFRATKAGHDNQVYQKKHQSTADTNSHPKLLLQEVGPM